MKRGIHTETKQAGLSPAVSAAAVWVAAEEAVRELDNEHTGRVCLVVLLSVISKILQPRDWGGKLTRAVKKNLSIWVNCSGKGSLVIIIRDVFFFGFVTSPQTYLLLI